MNNLCTDIGHMSLTKYGEELCGDMVEVIEHGDDDYVVVLADGLGSGVKANILSTLTSKIISTMIANNMPLEMCVDTIAKTLPICSVRQVAYSTFTIVRVIDNKEAEIAQYDNPHVILLRDGKNLVYPESAVEIDGKMIYKSKISLKLNDTLIFTSDGAVYAGIGENMNFGWQRDQIIEFMEEYYRPDFTAKTLSSLLLDQCDKLYGGRPGDDTTVCVVKIRERKSVNLLMGPPRDPADVNKMMSLFFGYDYSKDETASYWENGKKITVPELFTDKKGYLKSPELPYGTYVVFESTVPENLKGIRPFIVQISEDSREPQVWRVFDDRPLQYYFKIVKKDAQTQKPVLDNSAAYKIYDVEAEKYVEMIVRYPKKEVVSVFRTNEEGYLITPEQLKCGTYRIEEVEAPENYVRVGF